MIRTAALAPWPLQLFLNLSYEEVGRIDIDFAMRVEEACTASGQWGLDVVVMQIVHEHRGRLQAVEFPGYLACTWTKD